MRIGLLVLVACSSIACNPRGSAPMATAAPVASVAVVGSDVEDPFVAGGRLTIVGRVVDARGVAVADAEVVLSGAILFDGSGRRIASRDDFAWAQLHHGCDSAREEIAAGFAGQAGEFRLTVELPPGLSRLSLVAFDSRGRERGQVDLARAPGVVDVGDLRLGSRASWLTVVVLAQGQPVRNAWVWASGAEGGALWGDTALTDARGRVRILTPHDQAVSLEASSGELGAGREHVSMRGDRELTLELVRSLQITGRTAGANGGPLGGAVVEMWTLPTSGRLDCSDVTDVRGAFSIEGAGGRAILVASVNQARGDELVSAPLLVSRTSEGIELRLEPAAWIVIRSGGWALIEHEGHAGWLPVECRPFRSGDRTRVAPGRVRIRSRRGRTSDLVPFLVAPGQTIEVGEPEGPGRLLRARLVRRGGVPVGLAEVDVLDGPWASFAGETSPDGIVRARAAERALALRVHTGGPTPFEVPIPAGGDVDLGDVVVPD